jgi:DNA-binding GntR family transcriptional regulator
MMLSHEGENEKNHLVVPLVRRRDLTVPPIVFDRTNGVPLHAQITTQIAQMIRNGVLEHGRRLPSSRMMAKLLGVSRNTVLNSYEELVEAGLIDPVPGAGMRVNGGPAPMGLRPMRFRSVLRSAHFPSRIVSLTDPDGNPFYLNF